MPDKESARGVFAPEEVSAFCDQIGLMLASGMMLHDGVEALSENYRDTRDYDTFKAMAQSVEEDGSLYRALKESGRFPAYMVEMTGIGERTGKLEQVINGMSDFYLRESRIKSAVSGAVTYPIVLGIMLAGVVAVLITRVLPVFDQVLSGMGMDMTASGNSLLAFGMGMGRAVLIVVGALVIAALVLLALMRTRWKPAVLRLIRRVFPPINRLNRHMAAARFASVMAMMMQSGFPMDEAMRITPAVMSDEDARDKLIKMQAEMDEGVSFPDAIDHCGLFDKLHSRMIRMGHLAGQIDTVMRKVADIYEEEVDTLISSLISVIEPVLVALLSVVIGAILLSVMLPMAGVITSVI